MRTDATSREVGVLLRHAVALLALIASLLADSGYSAGPAEGAVFPLVVSDNGRYLVDEGGDSDFLLVLSVDGK